MAVKTLLTVHGTNVLAITADFDKRHAALHVPIQNFQQSATINTDQQCLERGMHSRDQPSPCKALKIVFGSFILKFLPEL